MPSFDLSVNSTSPALTNPPSTARSATERPATAGSSQSAQSGSISIAHTNLHAQLVSEQQDFEQPTTAPSGEPRSDGALSAADAVRRQSIDQPDHLEDQTTALAARRKAEEEEALVREAFSKHFTCWSPERFEDGDECTTMVSDMRRRFPHVEDVAKILGLDGTLFRYAAESGNKIELIDRLNRDPSIIDEADSGGWTALMKAAKNGHLEIVQELLGRNADTGKRNKQAHTALMTAASVGKLEIVKALLEARADINDRDNQGCTALFWSAFNGKKEVVDELLRRGADPSIGAEGGWTALMAAGHWGHDNVVESLLEHVVATIAGDNDAGDALDL